MGRKLFVSILTSLVAAVLMVGMCPAEQQRFHVPIGSSQVKGPADAPVTLIEFLDFQ